MAEVDAIELAAMRRELIELRTRVGVLETRLDAVEPVTTRGTGTPALPPNPLLDAVGDAIDALGFGRG